MTDSRALLRRRMRAARRAVPRQQRQRLARIIFRKLSALGLVRRGGRVAIYMPMAGEIPIEPLIKMAADRGCRLYLPRITDHRARRMTFAPFRAPFRCNQYGISEPARTVGAVSARWLDVVVAPLVAFDANLTRLGGGTGYYDRALRYRRLRQTWRRPKVVGVAFDFQRVTALERQPWDVPMDVIVTDRDIYRTRT